MNKLLVIVFLITALTFPQNVDSSFNTLFRNENIIKFADHLFCERDYLRSANEYLRIDAALRDEKINFKIALSFSIIGDHVSAKNIFGRITESSPYYNSSKLELMKILFVEEKYLELRELFKEYSNKKIFQSDIVGSKLYNLSYLKDSEEIPAFTDFVKPFDFTEHDEAAALYQMKINPSNKNPVLSSLLSAIIPGAGKIYTGEVSDGVLALITTGLFSFLAYDNFQADHKFRAWLFTGLAAGFYAGNVYGSFASAQIYNARIKYEFNLRLDSFLKSKNYFIPEYDFCK